MAGRRPKPVEVKQLTGNPGKRKLPTNTPKPRVRSLAVPRGQLSAEGKRVWRQLAPMLAKNGLLTEADGLALLMLCHAATIAMRAHAEAEEVGLTQVDDKGVIRPTPQVRIAKDWQQVFLRWCTEFGLTPSARGKLHVEGDAQERSLAEILFGVEEEDER